MPSVNKVFILGALGRDPETRFTNTNLQITSFSVATSTFRKGEDGERKEETEWHRVPRASGDEPRKHDLSSFFFSSSPRKRG